MRTNNENETVLTTIAGSSALQRLQVVLLSGGDSDGCRMELREQSWGEGVGWFTQTKVALEPHQIGQLKQSLGARVSIPASRPTTAPWQPRVVRAEPA